MATTNIQLDKTLDTDTMGTAFTIFNGDMEKIDAAFGALPTGKNVQGQIEDAQGEIEEVSDTFAQEFDESKEYDPREYISKDRKLYYLPYGHEADVAFGDFTKRQTDVGKELKHLDDLDIAQSRLDDEVFSYVPYYTNIFVQLAGGGTGASAIGVQGYKYEFVLDGTPTTQYWYCKITNGISRASSPSGLRGLTGGVFLKSGHKYRLTQKRISGSCTLISTGQDTLPLLRVYVKGTSTGVGTGIQNATAGIYTYDFTADNSEYIICFLMEDIKTLANYKCDVFLEDLTVKNLWGRDDAISIKGSATGNETSLEFPSGSDGMPTATTFGFEPSQSFNGYEHPWAGGNGKNLLNYESPTIYYKNSNFSYELTTDGIIAKASSSGSAYGYIDAGEISSDMVGNTYTFSCVSDKTPANSAVICICDASDRNRKSATYTIAAEDVGRHMCIYISTTYSIGDITYTNLQLEEGSSATTWVPYSNICPITGWTGCNISRTGKNLFDKNNTFASKKLISADGSIIDNNAYSYCIDYIRVKPNTAYVFSGTICSSGVYNAVAFYKDDKTFISRFTPLADGVGAQFTTPSNCSFIRFNVQRTVYNVDTIQLEEGTVSTAYEPFGQTYSITFPSAAGTVYGGTLAIDKSGSGTLTVTDGYIDGYNGETLPSTWISDRDVYAEGTTPTVGAQVVYKLETPVIYRFTAKEIPSLLGTNTIWVDTGVVLSVDYTADTKTYIDEAIADRTVTKSDTVLETTLSRGRKANTTVGEMSFAFGYEVEASGAKSFAEGDTTMSTARASHAEGWTTTASAAFAHAEGSATTASGNSAHAEGYISTASGSYSHAEGNYTTANHKAQHVSGELNVPDPSTAAATARGNYAEIVGNGTTFNNRSNARTLDWDGNERLKGDLYVNCNADSSGGQKVVPLPAAPTNDGTYSLQVTVSSGDATYSWQAETNATGVSF